MSSTLEISEPIASIHTNDNEVNIQVLAYSTQVEASNQENEHEESIVERRTKKDSVVWNVLMKWKSPWVKAVWQK